MVILLFRNILPRSVLFIINQKPMTIYILDKGSFSRRHSCNFRSMISAKKDVYWMFQYEYFALLMSKKYQAFYIVNPELRCIYRVFGNNISNWWKIFIINTNIKDILLKKNFPFFFARLSKLFFHLCYIKILFLYLLSRRDTIIFAIENSLIFRIKTINLCLSWIFNQSIDNIIATRLCSVELDSLLYS